MSIKPWQAVGAPAVLQTDHGKSLVVQRFLRADGQAVDYSLFTAAKNLGSVVVFALTAKQEVLAVRQFRPGARQVMTELPGGNAEGTESDQQAVRRELLEETHYRAGRIIPLVPSQLFIDPCSMLTHLVPFLALDCQPVSAPELAAGGISPNPDETLETSAIALADWLAMIRQGRIIDLKTVALTFLALAELKLLIPNWEASHA